MYGFKHGRVMLPYKVYLLVAVFTNLLQLIYFGWWRHQPIRKDTKLIFYSVVWRHSSAETEAEQRTKD